MVHPTSFTKGKECPEEHDLDTGKTKKQLKVLLVQQKQRSCSDMPHALGEEQESQEVAESPPSLQSNAENTETCEDCDETQSKTASEGLMEETMERQTSNEEEKDPQEMSEPEPSEEHEEEDEDCGEEEELEDEEEELEEEELGEEEEEDDDDEEDEEEEEEEGEVEDDDENIEGEEVDVENLEERGEDEIGINQTMTTVSKDNKINVKEVENGDNENKKESNDKKRKKEDETIVKEGEAAIKEKENVELIEADKEKEEDIEEEEEESVISTRTQRREAETTETETDDSEVEDFPTEGLLQELHFLNASCERPQFQKGVLSQVHKTPRKQRKLDFTTPLKDSKARDGARSGSSIKRKRIRKSATPSPRKHVAGQSPTIKSPKKSPVLKGEDKEQHHDDERFATDDEEDGEGVLTIVTNDDSAKKRKGTPSPRSRKKMRGEGGTETEVVPQEVIELIQSGIDEMLEEKAERTHLTAIHVKNIIKNVMTDENVLTMVRNTVLGIPVGDPSVSAVYEPTLTRAKTKELIQQHAAVGGQSNIWAGLSNHPACAATSFTPETQALVSVDFPDEDEDEEYKPEADDQLHSDEESLLSAGSPSTPCTMQSVSTPGSRHSLISYSGSRSGDVGTPASQPPFVFETPNAQKKSVQRILSFDKKPEEEEVVSQRTRSKLPLTETPLECLEMAFRPPDVTTDMYETEIDNEEWKEFLIDFIHPLKSTEVGEDEEADPEYNILEDKEDALDLREEMRGDRAVQIPKKEIQQLMTELLDALDGDERSEPIRAHLSQHIPREMKKSLKPQICQPDDQNQEAGPAEGSIWVEVMMPKLSPTQQEILQCQMVQHVQLLTTSVLMAHGSYHFLELKEVVDGCLENLEEIKRHSESADFQNTFFRPINLPSALEMVASLKDMNSSGCKNEVSSSNSSIISIPSDVMELVLNSSAFPYPNLLPTRMFQVPTMRGFKKVIFVSPEDILLALGLERHLNPKYHKEKCRKTQHFLLRDALTEATSSTLVGKTVCQASNRVKNIKCRARDTPNNLVLQYLETGKLDLPTAKAEPLLSCVPCPVLAMPENTLKNPFRNLVRKKQSSLRAALQKAAKVATYKAALALEQRALEAKCNGASEIQNQIHNIVIIQPPGNSAVVPSATCMNTPTVPLNFSSIMIVESSTQLQKDCSEPEPETFNDKSCAQTEIPGSELCSQTATCSSQSIQSICDDKPEGNHTSHEEDVHMEHSPVSGGDLDSVITPQAEKDTSSKGLSLDETLDCSQSLVGNAIDSPQSQTTESESCELTVPECDVNDRPSGLENSTTEEHPETVAQEEKEEEEVLAYNKSQLHESHKDLNIETSVTNYLSDCISSENIVRSQAISESQKNSGKKDGGDGYENMPLLQSSPGQTSLCDSTPPSTPDKLAPAAESFQSQYLYLCSPFTTPQKDKDQSSTPMPPLSTSPLCTPVLRPPSLANSPERALLELRQRNLTAELETSEGLHGVAGSLVKNISCTNSQAVPQETTLVEATTSSRRVTHSSIGGLVTSVYGGSDRKAKALKLINVTPKKPENRLRKISPAKTFKSPIKASPLKQVSPILRKYRKYSPKKRNSSGKLLPILPKCTGRQRKHPSGRILAPKPQKAPLTIVQENVAAQKKVAQHPRCESVLHRTKQLQSESVDLLSLEDQLGGEGVSTSLQPRAGQNSLEEDFEEDTLEEEEEEEEDEEEEDEDDDMATEQQREEHLAALLKASSTITLRRGGTGSDGGIGEHGGERKLTKQQKRLQARISALSSIPDPAAQDKFMAQSYLMRVREALVAQDPACFKRFLFILNNFTENPDRSPIQLYNELCEVLSDFPHLLEEFVAFLLPQQAIAIGKYAQYCAIHRMRDFLEKLELQFGKQPQCIQKIIRLLQSFQGRPNLDLEEVKAAITPLLRYPHLVECFTQCFPSQPPPPSLQSDFEDLKLERSGSVDSMEDLVLPDDDTSSSPNQCVCPCHSNAPSTHPTQPPAQPHTRTDHCHFCALRFSEGRVYLQCGKTLRPARVTYTESQGGVKVTPFGESNNEAQNEASKESAPA